MTPAPFLTPYLEAFVRQAVSSGRYRSASDVVRTALRLLEARDRQRATGSDQLHREIRNGFDRGPDTVFDIGALQPEYPEGCFTLNDVLAQRGKIAVIWSVADVLEVRSNLSALQAWEVLKRVRIQHDATLGVTWETLERAAEDLFGPPSAPPQDSAS